MTAEFKWIHISLFLTAALQFTAAAEKHRSSVAVRVGENVSLPCEIAVKNKRKCGSYTWLFSGLGDTAAVELVNLGTVKPDKRASDRLDVTEDCSLLIKKVKVEDVGRYTCREFISNNQGSDSLVHLSVIHMTEHKETDKVTLNCSVSTYEGCTLKVQWLYNGEEVNEHNQGIRTSQSGCAASVHFLSSHDIYTSRYKSLKCKVTDGDKEQQFDFIPQPSGEKPVEDKTTTTTTTTTESAAPPPTTTTESSMTELTRTTDSSTKAGTTASTDKGWWRLYIVVAVVPVALLIIVVKVIRGRRAEGNKTRTNDGVRLTSNPAGTQPPPPGSSQDTADPEDGVSYASVSYTKKTNSKAQVRSKKDDDEGDAVTYTTVKALSSDPSNLYATIS